MVRNEPNDGYLFHDNNTALDSCENTSLRQHQSATNPINGKLEKISLIKDIMSQRHELLQESHGQVVVNSKIYFSQRALNLNDQKRSDLFQRKFLSQYRGFNRSQITLPRPVKEYENMTIEAKGGQPPI